LGDTSLSFWILISPFFTRRFRAVIRPAHRRWLADVKMPQRRQQIVLKNYIEARSHCCQRLGRLTDWIRQMVLQWRLLPVVHARQNLGRFSLIVFAASVAEIGASKHFQNHEQLMSDLGLVPSEHSSGEKSRRGSITKTGNTTCAAWR
jgi:transposase